MLHAMEFLYLTYTCCNPFFNNVSLVITTVVTIDTTFWGEMWRIPMNLMINRIVAGASAFAGLVMGRYGSDIGDPSYVGSY